MVAQGPGKTSWKKKEGEQLLDALIHGEELEVDDVACIYMWKIRLRPRDMNVASPVACMKRIEQLANMDQGLVESARLSHSLRLLGVSIGGSGLPDDKTEVFKKAVTDKTHAKAIFDYLDELQSALPALYVGETGRLPTRVKQHLRGQTNFGEHVQQSDQLDWSDLTLFYYRVGPPKDADSPMRQALEYLTSVLTIAGFTERPG